MITTLRPELINLLQEVVRRHQSDLLPAVEQLVHNSLPSRLETGNIISLMAYEVARTGFFETEESIKRGLMLEEIADILGDIQKERKDD